MPDAISALGGANNIDLVDSDKTGFNGLTSEDFLKMLIVQLQNQDPTEPVGNDELLNQISQMRSLQSNIELGDSFQTITANQQLSTAAGLIGKEVTGIDETDNQQTGVVTRAFLANDKAFVELEDSTRLELSKVSAVDLPEDG